MIDLPGPVFAQAMLWATLNLFIPPGKGNRETYLELEQLAGYAFVLKVEFTEMEL